jgi:hypothetical protein
VYNHHIVKVYTTAEITCVLRECLSNTDWIASWVDFTAVLDKREKFPVWRKSYALKFGVSLPTDIAIKLSSSKQYCVGHSNIYKCIFIAVLSEPSVLLIFTKQGVQGRTCEPNKHLLHKSHHHYITWVMKILQQMCKQLAFKCCVWMIRVVFALFGQ